MSEPETRPVLALLAAPGTSGRAVPVLRLLAMDADVVSWHRRGDAEPRAVLATSVASLADLAEAPDVPTAVWVEHHDQIDAAFAAGATVILTSQPDLVARGAVLVPRIGIEVDRWPAVAPLVRRRWRERLGLPEHHVVRVQGAIEPGAGEDEIKVASVVVVSGPATLLALALGAPVVTSADTARRLGLRAGRDAEVAPDPTSAQELAEAICADDARAAALSRRARRCAEHHLDIGRPAGAIAAHLGLSGPTESGGLAERLDLRLDELGTPPHSPIRLRSAAALAVDARHGQGSSP